MIMEPTTTTSKSFSVILVLMRYKFILQFLDKFHETFKKVNVKLFNEWSSWFYYTNTYTWTILEPMYFLIMYGD